MRRRFYHMNPPLWDFSNYMTIESLGVASVAFMRKVEYTKDGRVWKTLEALETLRMKGECVSFKSVLEPGEVVGYINLVGRCNLRGNCLSLIFGDEASGKNDIHLYPNCFSGIFANNEIINIDKGFLPATTLADRCYDRIFYGCTSLVTAPELPATTLAAACYAHMFQSCTKLNYIKMLATDISAMECLTYWVYEVASKGTFVKNPAINRLPIAEEVNFYRGIPPGWKIINDGEE